MSNPTYRERTNAFKRLRTGFASQRPIIHSDLSDSSEPAKSLLPPHQNEAAQSINIPMIVSISPIWMQCVDMIDDKLDKIQHHIGELKEYYRLRQRVYFDDDKAAEYDMNIQEVTHSITSLLKAAKVNLQQIAIKGNEANENNMGFEERTARYNAMRSRAMKLQEFTKLFRDTQRQYLQAMNVKLNSSHKYVDIMSITNTLPDLSNIYEGFNVEQIALIEQKEKEANDREREILEIAKSVHELAQLFNELSILIVEQGTVLDRIDYNVEQTLETLNKTVPVIGSADKYQKRSRMTLCILVLILLIIFMAAVLVLKHSI